MAGKKVVGVLALQGAFREHQDAIDSCGATAIKVRTREDVKAADALIIPGGESTTIGRLMKAYDLGNAIIEQSREGMPIFGTCAGMIVMAKETPGYQQYSLGIMDISVRRNGFGRQIDRFEAELDIQGFSDQVRGVFIRAPFIDRVWGETQVLCKYMGQTVMAREKNLLTASFHPELTRNLAIHQYFLSMI